MHKLSTLASGMILTPRSIAVIVTSTVTSFLLKRWGYRVPMLLGLSIICLETILLGEGPQLLGMTGNHFGTAESIAFIVMIIGVGIGIGLHEEMPQKEKRFIVSIKEGNPQ